MSLRVDLNNHTISGAVVELIDFQRSQPVASGLVGRLRAQLGTRIHQEYRLSKQDVSGHQSEVGVELNRTFGGFRLQLGGRIDGLTETEDGLLLEEVKSVVVGGFELSHAREGFFPDWELQLRLYALALQEVYPTKTICAQLVLISLTDQTQKSIPIAINHQATENLLEQITLQVIEQAREEHLQAEQRRALAAQITFPYPETRQHQKELIELFAKGLANQKTVLAMAPTGIGKTVAALMAGLQFALEQNAILAFLTAKTTQQELVGSTFTELHRSSGWPQDGVHCLILRAKEKMCPTGHMLCHPQICPLLEKFQTRNDFQVTKQVLASGALIDPEVVLGIAEAHRLCPFHLSLALVERVSLVVCDYNYVYDPGIALMDIVDSPTRPFVAIVDEAHNLFDRARGYYSPSIHKRQLVELRAQIKSGAFLASSDQTDQLQLAGMVSTISGPALFTEVVCLLDQVEVAITDERKQSEESLPNAPDHLICQPDGMRWHHIGQRACELLVPYILYNRTHQLFHDNDPLLNTLTQLMHLKEVMQEPCREVVPYTTSATAQQGLGFGNLCVNPARRLAQQHKRALGTIAMSATLTPLDYYTDVLGFDAEAINTSAPSPFPKENLGVWVVGHIDTTFRKRDEYITEIASVIQTTLAAKSGRYVAFFPSFKFLSQVHTELCKRPQQAQIIMQLPGLAEASRRLMLSQFRKAKGPTLLMAVMGGIFAEGVDLPGEELIGAIVVGPGLPQVGFERSVMQHYFQEEYEQGFAYAMLYPGLQRVIQSAGRVIRTPHDKGVIVLIGRRFAQPELAHSLPEHWYRYSPEELIASDLQHSLQTFWSNESESV